MVGTIAYWRRNWPTCPVCARPLDATNTETPLGPMHKGCAWRLDQLFYTLTTLEESQSTPPFRPDNAASQAYDLGLPIMLGDNLALISLFAELISNDPKITAPKAPTRR